MNGAVDLPAHIPTFRDLGGAKYRPAFDRWLATSPTCHVRVAVPDDTVLLQVTDGPLGPWRLQLTAAQAAALSTELLNAACHVQRNAQPIPTPEVADSGWGDFVEAGGVAP
jgi:hypothetical protein